MRKFLIVMVVSVIFCINGGFLSCQAKEKGASKQAYEHASENSVFNRISDWFATVGKSDEEKAKILAERKAKRAAKQGEKQAKKASKSASEAMGMADETSTSAKKSIKAKDSSSEVKKVIHGDDDMKKVPGME